MLTTSNIQKGEKPCQLLKDDNNNNSNTELGTVLYLISLFHCTWFKSTPSVHIFLEPRLMSTK